MGPLMSFTIGLLGGSVVGWFLNFIWDYFDKKALEEEIKKLKKKK